MLSSNKNSQNVSPNDKSRNNKLTANKISSTASFGHNTLNTQKSAFSSSSTIYKIGRGAHQNGVGTAGGDKINIKQQAMNQNNFGMSRGHDQNEQMLGHQGQTSPNHYIKIPGLSQKYSPPTPNSARVGTNTAGQNKTMNYSNGVSLSPNYNNRPGNIPMPSKNAASTQLKLQNEMHKSNNDTHSSQQSISPKFKVTNQSSSGLLKGNQSMSSSPLGYQSNTKVAIQNSYNTLGNPNRIKSGMRNQSKSSVNSSTSNRPTDTMPKHSSHTLNNKMMQKRAILANNKTTKAPLQKAPINANKQTLSMKQFVSSKHVVDKKQTKKILTQSKISQNKGVKTASINISDNTLTPQRRNMAKRSQGNSIGSNKSSKGSIPSRKNTNDISSSSSHSKSKKVIKQKLLFDPQQQVPPQTYYHNNNQQNQHSIDSASPPSPPNVDYNMQAKNGHTSHFKTTQSNLTAIGRVSYASQNSNGPFYQQQYQSTPKTEHVYNMTSKPLNQPSPINVESSLGSKYPQITKTSMTKENRATGKNIISQKNNILPKSIRKTPTRTSMKPSEMSAQRKSKNVNTKTLDLISIDVSPPQKSNNYISLNSQLGRTQNAKPVQQINIQNKFLKKSDSSNLRYASISPRNNIDKYQPYGLEDENVEEVKSNDSNKIYDKTIIVSPQSKHKYSDSQQYGQNWEGTEKKERSIYDETSGGIFSQVKSSPTSPVKMANLAVGSSQKVKQPSTVDPTDRCSYALKLIEEIEHSSRREEQEFKTKSQVRKGEVNRDSSEDSNDSLIQTQRKLKKEYDDFRKSQQDDNFLKPNNKKQNNVSRDPQNMRSSNLISDSPVRKSNKITKISSQSTNKKVYIKQANINLMSQIASDKENQKSQNRETVSEKESINFPMGQFLSASSDFEENMVIERFSMQLHSQSQGSILNGNEKTQKNLKRKLIDKQKLSKQNNNDLYFTKNHKALNDGLGFDVRPVITESQAVQNTINSLQSLNSLKPFHNDSMTTKDLFKQIDPKPIDQYSQLERISSVQKKSIVQTNESEKCPFKTNNRSPDSFVRISINGKDEMQHNMTRVSLLSMVQNSETKTSHISQKSSLIQTEANKSIEHLSQYNRSAQKEQKEKSSPIAFEMVNKTSSQQSIPTFEQRLKTLSSPQTQKSNQTISTQKSLSQKKSNNNIEINIEKILQIIQLLEGVIDSQQNLIIVNDIRGTFKQNKDFQAKFERINEERLHQSVNLCEEWWNIIREPTVSQQLNKSIKILSHTKIQNGLRKSMIYQLMFFSLTGYLYSQQQYQFADILTELAYYNHLNFSVMCLILVEKFPEEIIKRNAWANKLQQELHKNKKMQQQLNKIQENVTLTSNSSNQVNHSIELAEIRSMASGVSAVSQKTLLGREVKHQYLKINNKMCHDLFLKLLSITENEPDYDDAFNCLLITQLKNLVKQIESPDMLLMDSIDRIGKALREDYNEDCIPNLPDQNDIKTIQDQVSHNLRVQIDNGLKLIPMPYLPRQTEFEFTLVLDLDETLLHFEELNDNEGQLSIRPGADSFLKLMSQYYYIAIFTAGTEEYADWALSFLENQNLINFRLYRQHALPFNGFYVKDLSRLGSDLSKTLIVDNIAENFQLQPYNGIFIKTWIDAADDVCLFTLAPFLIQIVKDKVVDVRDFMKKMHIRQDRVLDEVAYGPSVMKAQNGQTPEKQVQHQKMNAIDELTSEEDMSNSFHEISAQAKLREEINNMKGVDYMSPPKNQVINSVQDPMSAGQRGNSFGVSVQPPTDYIEYRQQFDQQKPNYLTPKNHNSEESLPQSQIQHPPTCYTILESQNENGSSLDLSPNTRHSRTKGSTIKTSFRFKESDHLRKQDNANF